MTALTARLADWARSIRRDVRAVYLASRDSRTPWYAKALAVGVAAYALSPIDLIPDFIPILGQLDELIILPLGIWLVVRMIPAEVIAEHRRSAVREQAIASSMAGAAVIVAVWLLLTAGAGWLAYRCLF